MHSGCDTGKACGWEGGAGGDGRSAGRGVEGEGPTVESVRAKGWPELDGFDWTQVHLSEEGREKYAPDLVCPYVPLDRHSPDCLERAIMAEAYATADEPTLATA